jgi:predicted nucleotidyltransferase
LNILEILKSHRNEMKMRFSVERIGLFGSHARGNATPESDVDILVEFKEPTFRNFMGLVFFLEDLLKIEVELVTPDSLSPYIRPYVEKEVVWSE